MVAVAWRSNWIPVNCGAQPAHTGGSAADGQKHGLARLRATSFVIDMAVLRSWRRVSPSVEPLNRHLAMVHSRRTIEVLDCWSSTCLNDLLLFDSIPDSNLTGDYIPRTKCQRLH
jgi:hypothetical protein